LGFDKINAMLFFVDFWFWRIKFKYHGIINIPILNILSTIFIQIRILDNGLLTSHNQWSRFDAIFSHLP
jgi:hypothetical protein